MSLSWKRAALALLAVIVAVLALSPLGRHERAQANRGQAAGIAETSRLTHRYKLDAYRVTHWADCLLHKVGIDPYALEVCYDAHGRAVEAIDRRVRAKTRIWSVRYEPNASRTHADPAALFRVFQGMGAFPKQMRFAGALPLAASLSLPPETHGDSGPIVARLGRQ